MKRETVSRVVGFSCEVRKLGKHTLRGERVYYTPQHIRGVLKSETKPNEAILERIARRAPVMFELCKVSPCVRRWHEKYKKADKNG